MDFDFSQVSVPFRMRPGLARLAPDTCHLTPLCPGTALHGEKQAIQRHWRTRHTVDGFDPTDAMAAIHAQVLQAGVDPAQADTAPLELLVQEDLVVLDTSSGRIPWMCVCVPSHWAPEDKICLGLDQVHRPVADGAALAAALPHLLRVLANGSHWVRFVWTLTPSPRFDQHPHRQVHAPWPDTRDAGELARQCHFRAERQTFLPVFDAQGQPLPLVVFTIRVMVEPLAAVLHRPADAQRLADSIASMTDAVLAYKHLAPARDRLLEWLGARAQQPAPAPAAPV